MELFIKIKNKENFIFSLALLLSVAIIPSVKLPYKDSESYLFFSDYSFVQGFLLFALVYLYAIAEEKWHIQSIKMALILIWVFFILETINPLINYIEFVNFYYILNTLQAGSYIDFLLLIIITFKSFKFTVVEKNRF